MRKILQRYLGANFILPFMVSLLFFVMFLLTFQLFRITGLVINKGVPLVMIAELLAHISISFLPMAIPLAVLFAMIYVMNKMSGDSEIMVMRSFGFSKYKLFIPFILIGILIGTTTFALNHSIIPYSKREFKRALILLTSRGFLADIKPGQFFTAIPGITLFAGEVHEKGNLLHDVFINVDKGRGADVHTIKAGKGRLVKVNPNKWGHSSLRLKLFDGNILKQSNKDDSAEKILFQEYDFPISDGSIRAGMVTKRSMRTSSELYEMMERDKKKIPTIKDPVELKDWKESAVDTEIEFWSRINTPLACLVYILLGFVLGIQRTRGDSKNTTVLTMIVLVLYYSLFFGGLNLARKFVIPAEVAVFIPTFLGLAIGLWFFRKMEWES